MRYLGSGMRFLGCSRSRNRAPFIEQEERANIKGSSVLQTSLLQGCRSGQQLQLPWFCRSLH